MRQVSVKSPWIFRLMTYSPSPKKEKASGPVCQTPRRDLASPATVKLHPCTAGPVTESPFAFANRACGPGRRPDEPKSCFRLLASARNRRVWDLTVSAICNLPRNRLVLATLCPCGSTFTETAAMPLVPPVDASVNSGHRPAFNMKQGCGRDLLRGRPGPSHSSLKNGDGDSSTK